MKEGKVDYIEMIWEKEPGNVTNLNIRYGKNHNRLDRAGLLTKRSGRKLKFRTIQEAVNYVKRNGWSDVRSFIQCFSGRSVYHFIFKRIK
ncbi:MAG: hypothetical protein ABFR36_01120 [Acidobacteriota bacterium]